MNNRTHVKIWLVITYPCLVQCLFHQGVVGFKFGLVMTRYTLARVWLFSMPGLKSFTVVKESHLFIHILIFYCKVLNKRVHVRANFLCINTIQRDVGCNIGCSHWFQVILNLGFTSAPDDIHDSRAMNYTTCLCQFNGNHSFKMASLQSTTSHYCFIAIWK